MLTNSPFSGHYLPLAVAGIYYILWAPFLHKDKLRKLSLCELEWTSLAARRPQCATGGNYCFLTSQLENIQTTNTHTAPVFQHQTRARVRLQLKIFLLLFLFVRGIETQTFSSLQAYKQLLLVFFHFFRSPLPHWQDILNTSMLKITNNIIGENFPGTSSLLQTQETNILQLS